MNRKTILFSLLFVATAVMAGTTLVIKPLSGNEHAEALSQIGHLKMTQDSLCVYSHSGFLLGKNAIKDISYIRFDGQEADAIENTEATATCRVYPNPTQDMLIIDNADSRVAHVFDLNGRLLQSVSLQEEKTTINVSSLPRGEYLLLLNTKTYKFIKQ